jgi:hypothetical protein
MPAERDLFTPAPRLEPQPAPPPPFDPHHHPCAVCGASHAPFGCGFPHATKFYCRDHRPGLKN